MARPECPDVSTLSGEWWVAHTKARFEKAFAWDLLRAGVDFFLPMVERLTISGGRKRRGMAPLFTSYVFFNGSPAARYLALATNRLCQVIPVVNRDLFVEEIASLQRAVQGKCELDPYPRLAVGRRCRIVRGALAGLEGALDNRDDITRLVLHVSMLGQGASLEIAADLLEVLD